MNIVALEGNITADTELKESGEYKYCKFNIAVNEGYGDKKKTHFIPCIAWGKTAEFMANYVSKGDMVSVEGRLQQSQWQDQDGNNRSAIGVSANQVNLLRKKDSQATKQVKDTFESPPFDDSNIPF